MHHYSNPYNNHNTSNLRKEVTEVTRSPNVFKLFSGSTNNTRFRL